MESKSYSQLLGKLADALRAWASELFYDDQLHNDIDYHFRKFVEQSRLDVFVRLGVERRDLLAEVIDTSLNRVKERSKAFVNVCRRLRRKDFRTYADLQYQRREPLHYGGLRFSFPPKALYAAENLWISMNECDFLFQSIDREIRQADPIDGDNVDQYKPRFKSFTSSEFTEKLGGITTATLNKYAKLAKVQYPKRGKGNFLYSLDASKTICEYIIAKGSTRKIKAAARKLLPEILAEIAIKSNNQNEIET